MKGKCLGILGGKRLFFSIYIFYWAVKWKVMVSRKRHFWHPPGNGLTRSLQGLTLRIGNFQSVDPSENKWEAGSQTPEHLSSLWYHEPGLDGRLFSCNECCGHFMEISHFSGSNRMTVFLNRLSRWNFEIFLGFWVKLVQLYTWELFFGQN